MFELSKNSKRRGDMGLAIAISYFTCKGYTIALPLTDSQNYDLIVDINDKLKKVQVKTTSCKSLYSLYQVDLRTKGGNRSGVGKIKKFDPTKCEFVFVVTEENIMYLIPSKFIKGLSGISLGKNYTKFKVK